MNEQFVKSCHVGLHSIGGGRRTSVSALAGSVKSTVVEFEANDSEDDDREEHQQVDLEQRSHSADDGLENHLQTCNAQSVRA
jgi:hypothetical protein